MSRRADTYLLILPLIRERPLTVPEIAARLGKPYEAIHSTLIGMVRRGEAKRLRIRKPAEHARYVAGGGA